ncbi:MAG TPA: 3-oxoacid CoA-transferase subunit B [Bacillales bacterium]|nr:3-oxoacid CoA-transferase subunit B [Bacillales bacterium]
MLKKKHPHRIRIANRIAKELESGDVINLGVGIPTLIPDYVDPGKKLYLQSENGVLGMGPTPPDEEIDMDLISASKKPITYDAGAALFHSADSFAMIRGGHVNVAVLGALQVSETGEIANWAIPGETILGVGGAMDLVAGARRLIIALTHISKNGEPKLVEELSFPTSGVRKAQMAVTEKGVFTFEDGVMTLTEIAPDVSVEEVYKTTKANFTVASDLKIMETESEQTIN